MGGRVVDCARLESVYTERYRGFESPPIRQFLVSITDAAVAISLTKIAEESKTGESKNLGGISLMDWEKIQVSCPSRPLSSASRGNPLISVLLGGAMAIRRSSAIFHPWDFFSFE